jgi:hypothetical protein
MQGKARSIVCAGWYEYAQSKSEILFLQRIQKSIPPHKHVYFLTSFYLNK